MAESELAKIRRLWFMLHAASDEGIHTRLGQYSAKLGQNTIIG